jgi:hypothetical protein
MAPANDDAATTGSEAPAKPMAPAEGADKPAAESGSSN